MLSGNVHILTWELSLFTFKLITDRGEDSLALAPEA
jgi:hypothetical protein